MTKEQILAFLPPDVKFMYKSYNHKQAVKEFNQMLDGHKLLTDLKNPNCHYIGDELKEKHIEWKVGRIHQVVYRKSFTRYRIGNKYPKSFYINDFGVNFKPLLRSLSSLTTEQEINGEMAIKFLEKQFLAEGVLEYGESPYGWTGFYNESREIYLPIHLDGEIMDECSWGIIQWLLQHHFNIFNLPETDFVDLNSRKSSN
jgi:hypothetical protein